MKKVNKYNILVLISIIILTSSFIFTLSLNFADELWNYNFSRNLSNGLLPYEEFSLLVPHIIYEIPAFLFRVINTELMIFRITTIILATSVFYLVYKLILKLINNKNASFILTIALTIFNMMFYYYEYNRFIILISLILLLLELKYIDKNKLLSYNKKHDITIGILLGLSVLVKHTIGIIMIIGILGYKLLLVSNKLEVKTYFKIFITRLIASLIPIFIYIIYLYYLGVLSEFIDYTILGISTFTNKLPFNIMITEQQNILLKILNIILVYSIPITLIFLFISGIKRKNRTIINDKNMILFAYGIITYSIFFPLTDLTHYQSASLITMIAIIYNLSNLKIIDRTKMNIPNKIIIGLIILLVLVISIYKVNSYLNGYKLKMNNFNYVTLDKSFEEHIIEVNAYIENKTNEGYNVYILDFRAVTHMIPLDRYNKDYDMFNKGNFGLKGEKGIIDRIEEEKENSLYLIINNYTQTTSPNSQNPTKVREHLQLNLEKVDTIRFYDVYAKR